MKGVLVSKNKDFQHNLVHNVGVVVGRVQHEGVGEAGRARHEGVGGDRHLGCNS